MRGAIIVAALSLGGAAAAQVASFDFDPKPRWAEDPETEIVCEAIRSECASKLKDDSIEAEWSYAELYDADGMLVGIHSLQSTGCKPLDEHLLLSHQHFMKAFSKAGQPDLEAISAVLKRALRKTPCASSSAGPRRSRWAAERRRWQVNLPDISRTGSRAYPPPRTEIERG